MNFEPLDPESQALADRLAKFRPAPASVALRERLRTQRNRKVISFRRWRAAGIAALAAALVFGAFTMLRAPVSSNFAVTVSKESSAVAASQRLLSVKEIGLIRRGLEPPVQLLAVEDVTIAGAAPTNAADKPQVQFSTRIVPVVLQYY